MKKFYLAYLLFLFTNQNHSISMKEKITTQNLATFTLITDLAINSYCLITIKPTNYKNKIIITSTISSILSNFVSLHFFLLSDSESLKFIIPITTNFFITFFSFIDSYYNYYQIFLLSKTIIFIALHTICIMNINKTKKLKLTKSQIENLTQIN